MTSLSPLMVITDRLSTGGRPLADVVHAALDGGARLIQLREKDLDGGESLRLAEELRGLTSRFGAKLLVNDRIDVALGAEADGVVLPADSFPTGAARSLLGSARLIARSTHEAAEVERARREGCDLVLFGPLYPTPSKTGPPQGTARLREAAAVGIPVYAVGGVTAGNAREAVDAGARGVAVIRAVMAAERPEQAVRDLLRALGDLSSS